MARRGRAGARHPVGCRIPISIAVEDTPAAAGQAKPSGLHRRKRRSLSDGNEGLKVNSVAPRQAKARHSRFSTGRRPDPSIRHSQERRWAKINNVRYLPTATRRRTAPPYSSPFLLACASPARRPRQCRRVVSCASTPNTVPAGRGNRANWCCSCECRRARPASPLESRRPQKQHEP
jgi:hypothetical protein